MVSSRFGSGVTGEVGIVAAFPQKSFAFIDFLLIPLTKTLIIEAFGA
jgi:hypothetical protein